jgi:threonine aldolase
VPSGSAAFLERLAAEGVAMTPLGPTAVRAVTHLDVDDAGIDRALDVLRPLVGA